MVAVVPFVFASITFAWFWFSLSPGSMLGFALTTGDWGRLFRDLGDKKLQHRSSLRSAGHRSLASHLSLIAVGVAGGVISGKTALAEYAVAVPAIVIGLVLGYFTLIWSTRRGGWYGVA